MYTISLWYVVVLSLAALIAGLLAISLLRYRTNGISRWLFRFLGALTAWALLRLVVVVRRATGPPQPEFLDQFGLVPLDLVGPFVGASIAVIALLMFALAYTGHEELVTGRTVALAAVAPTLLVGSAVTNDLHHLFWPTVERVDDLDGWVRTAGPLLYLTVAYLYGLAVTAMALLSSWALRSRALYRWQAIVIVASVVPPLGLSLAWIVGIVPIDLTEVGFTFTGLLLWIAVTRYDLGDVVPVARSTVLEAIGVGVVVIDENAQIVDVNPAAERILGAEAGQLLGAPVDALADRLDIADDALADALVAGGERTVDGTDGDRTFRLEVTTPPHDRTIDDLRVLLLYDITEQRERQRELARQNERLDRFASMVSHDLRNPLNVAMGRLALAREENGDDHLDAAETALERIESLIEDTMTIARTGQPVEDTAPVGLKAVAERAWAMIDSGGARLIVTDEVTVHADDSRLQQLFENLFRNAVEHGDENVTVRVGALEDRDGFFVQDDGPGIPAEDREHVFEAGYTTAVAGTGVGLAIVGEVVDAHQWTIGVTESEAGGARFEITDVTIDRG